MTGTSQVCAPAALGDAGAESELGRFHADHLVAGTSDRAAVAARAERRASQT